MASDADRLADAQQLAAFANTLARAELADMVPIIALAIDDAIELLRRTCPPSPMIESLAAIAAELHKRHPPRPAVKGTYAPHVGNC